MRSLKIRNPQKRRSPYAEDQENVIDSVQYCVSFGKGKVVRNFFQESGCSREPSRFRWIGIVVALMVLAPSVAVVGVQAGNGFEPAPNRVQAVSASDNRTISWDIRAGRAVRLRLYRISLDGAESLVGEFLVPQGISSFQTVDHSPLRGLKIYRLTVNGFDGTEITLGSITCIEMGFESGSDSRVSFVRLDLAVVVPEINNLSDGGATRIGFSGRISRSSWLNGPDPPVPRA